MVTGTSADTADIADKDDTARLATKPENKIPQKFGLLVSRIIPPLVHTVEDGAIAGAGVAHKDQRERCAIANREFARADDNAEATGYGNRGCNQGAGCIFNNFAHPLRRSGIACGIPSKRFS